MNENIIELDYDFVPCGKGTTEIYNKYDPMYKLYSMNDGCKPSFDGDEDKFKHMLIDNNGWYEQIQTLKKYYSEKEIVDMPLSNSAEGDLSRNYAAAANKPYVPDVNCFGIPLLLPPSLLNLPIPIHGNIFKAMKERGKMYLEKNHIYYHYKYKKNTPTLSCDHDKLYELVRVECSVHTDNLPQCWYWFYTFIDEENMNKEQDKTFIHTNFNWMLMNMFYEASRNTPTDPTKLISTQPLIAYDALEDKNKVFRGDWFTTDDDYKYKYNTYDVFVYA